MLSRNIDRLRSEQDIRNLQLARIAQAKSEHYSAFEDGLQRRLGRPVTTRMVDDPTKVKADPDAERKLRKIFG